MSTPRRGVRRPQSQRRPATEPPTGTPQPQVTPDPVTISPAAGAEEPDQGTLMRVVEWASWAVIWVSAIGAGFFLGKITFSKVFFIFIMLVITVLPWMRWVRRGSPKRLPPSRIAGLQGGLAIFVGLVLSLSATYVWALAVVIVELPLAFLVLLKAARPRPAES